MEFMDRRKLFLPMSRYEMQRLEWDTCDVVLITGDAYIDHPAHDDAMIARLLESEGMRVGIIAQPNDIRLIDFMQLGRPNAFFIVTAGVLDSMMNKYSPTKRPRKQDFYSAGRLPGKRPDHAAVVYARCAKQAYPDCPVIQFGMESTLRRLAHFDFHNDEVKPSVLIEGEADLIVYGQSEKAFREIAAVFRRGGGVDQCRDIRGVVWRLPPGESASSVPDAIPLPAFEDVAADRAAFYQMARIDLRNVDPHFAKPMTQEHAAGTIVVNPPQLPLTTAELDELFTLPFVRTPHPKYKKQGPIPNFETIKFSLVSHRGCPAGCSFCTHYAYQGRYVTSRSEESILEEARTMTGYHYFRNVISNIGGPVGNAYRLTCAKMSEADGGGESCQRASCTFPDKCEKLNADQGPYLQLLKNVLDLEGVDEAYISSNFRYDLLETEPHGPELEELLLTRFTHGKFKPSPLHVNDAVTRRIRKYQPGTTRRFFERVHKVFEKYEMLDDTEVVPFFMASHPGSTMDDALETAMFMDEFGLKSNYILDFVPAPSTASACMAYTGQDPVDEDHMYRPLSFRERKLQRALMNYYRPENAHFVYEALKEIGRTDLIGDTPGCLLTEVPQDYYAPRDGEDDGA